MYRVIVTGEFSEDGCYTEETLRQSVMAAAEEAGMSHIKVTLEDEDCIKVNDSKDKADNEKATKDK